MRTSKLCTEKTLAAENASEKKMFPLVGDLALPQGKRKRNLQKIFPMSSGSQANERMGQEEISLLLSQRQNQFTGSIYMPSDVISLKAAVDSGTKSLVSNGGGFSTTCHQPVDLLAAVL